jgi:capsule polysaccharide export protein KpsE/RkpR
VDKNAHSATPLLERALSVDVRGEETNVPDSLDSTPRQAGLEKLLLLWDHRRLMGRVILCALLASTFIAFVIPTRYESTARLMPPDAQSGNGMAMLAALSARGDSSLGGFAGDVLGIKHSGALFVGILQSRTVADRIAERFQLGHLYHVSNIEDVRAELASRTSIGEDRKSGLLTVAVTDHDPQRAAAITQAYVDELDRLVAQVSTSAARRERIFLEERLHAVKRDLDATAQKFSEFASKNTAIDIPAQGKAMVEGAARLQGELIAAESELRGLEQIYTDQNVRVRALRARVAELRQHLDGLDAGNSRRDGQDESSLYPSIRQLPSLGVTYADLYRQQKIQESVYELLTQQYELAKVQEAKEIPSVRVLDAPVVPTKKTFPPRLLLIFWGTTLASISAAIWVFGKIRWDNVDPRDPRKLFAQEVFTTIKGRIPMLSQNGVGAHGAESDSSQQDLMEPERRN